MEAYACEIIDRLDTRRVIAHRLYRQVFSFSEETSFLFIFFSLAPVLISLAESPSFEDSPLL
jgi:TFIIF-interacting CTD phosphatase-like protein